MTAKINLQPGERYSRLVTIEQAPDKGKALAWLCQCDCGKKHTVRVGDLRAGAVKSCGCLAREYRKSVTRRRNFNP